MKSTLRNMIISLGVISLVVALALGGVYDATSEPREQAADRARLDAIGSVLPDFDNDPVADADTAAGCEIYPAVKSGRFVGAAVRVSAPDGFAGPIVMMVGFDAAGSVAGYSILDHAETPGLGAKAAEWFCDTVGHRSVIGTDFPLAVSKDGGTVDAITAATITSRAFLDGINRARRAYIIYKDRNK